MTLSTLGLGALAAAVVATALGCAVASNDPLYGTRPAPPPAPRLWAQPPYPQKVVTLEPPPNPSPAASQAFVAAAFAPQESPPAPPADPAASPAAPQETPSAPPAAALSPAEALAAQRAANESCFERDYLRVKERLFDEHAGHWLAIVAGRLLPTDARGRPAPAPLLADALNAADTLDRDALHRFVFRVGEEGDLLYPDPLPAPQDAATARVPPPTALVGVGAKLRLAIQSRFDPAGPAILWTRGGASHRFPLERDTMSLRLADPTGRTALVARLADSASYAGFLLLDAANADLLDAERFEVPGRVVLEHGDALRELRRSRLRLVVPELELDELLPAAIAME